MISFISLHSQILNHIERNISNLWFFNILMLYSTIIANSFFACLPRVFFCEKCMEKNFKVYWTRHVLKTAKEGHEKWRYQMHDERITSFCFSLFFNFQIFVYEANVRKHGSYFQILDTLVLEKKFLMRWEFLFGWCKNMKILEIFCDYEFKSLDTFLLWME